MSLCGTGCSPGGATHAVSLVMLRELRHAIRRSGIAEFEADGLPGALQRTLSALANASQPYLHVDAWMCVDHFHVLLAAYTRRWMRDGKRGELPRVILLYKENRNDVHADLPRIRVDASTVYSFSEPEHVRSLDAADLSFFLRTRSGGSFRLPRQHCMEETTHTSVAGEVSLSERSRKRPREGAANALRLQRNDVCIVFDHSFRNGKPVAKGGLHFERLIVDFPGSSDSTVNTADDAGIWDPDPPSWCKELTDLHGQGCKDLVEDACYLCFTEQDAATYVKANFKGEPELSKYIVDQPGAMHSATNWQAPPPTDRTHVVSDSSASELAASDNSDTDMFSSNSLRKQRKRSQQDASQSKAAVSNERSPDDSEPKSQTKKRVTGRALFSANATFLKEWVAAHRVLHGARLMYKKDKDANKEAMLKARDSIFEIAECLSRTNTAGTKKRNKLFTGALL